MCRITVLIFQLNFCVGISFGLYMPHFRVTNLTLTYINCQFAWFLLTLSLSDYFSI